MEVDQKNIVLNVGGKKFQTLASTLSKFEGTFFQGILDSEPQKEYFIDRDPIIFQSVLYFLRSGKIELFGNTSLEAIYNELDFYSIPFEKRIPIDGIVYQCKSGGGGEWLFPGYAYVNKDHNQRVNISINHAEVLEVLLSLGFFKKFVGAKPWESHLLVPGIFTLYEGMKKFREAGYIVHSATTYCYADGRNHFYSFSIK